MAIHTRNTRLRKGVAMGSLVAATLGTVSAVVMSGPTDPDTPAISLLGDPTQSCPD